MLEMRLLSKSRFKTGLECPNKLYYIHHQNIYPSSKEEDAFLQALAQGGFQVEEFARLHYPEGQLIENPHSDYAGAVNKTIELLHLENVVIFEAAFWWDNLFIRTDILVKKGNRIDLIEVKAKLFDPNDENMFVSKTGIRNSWKPYLHDLAFQKYVITRAFPNFMVIPHLMMVDKNKKASIDGLNQLFRISNAKIVTPSKDVIQNTQSLIEIGSSILSSINVSDIIQKILQDKNQVLKDHTFEVAIELLSKIYQTGTYPNWPTQYGACKKCEFRSTDAQLQAGKKSGFHNCMTKQHGWAGSDALSPNIFEIWDFRGKHVSTLFEENRLLMNQLKEEDFQPEYKPSIISRTERQWIQVEKAKNQDDSIHCLVNELKIEMESWHYPLHCIDFETSAVALPFTKGRRPYEQVAFQFSHHILEKNGSIRHQSEFLNATPGVFPNFEFARALKDALGNDSGSIFKFASHENTILNAIIEQLKESNQTDKEALISFLKSISTSKKGGNEVWKGPREMIDLREIILKYYYNPLTRGSNSIKAVLPAAIQSSTFLREKYSKPLNAIGVSSLNFPNTHVWLKARADTFISPYKILKPLFEGWEEDDKDELLSEIDAIADGGMALTAYAKLQYVDMSREEREELSSGLKKYCELDTLAMVMILEHFKELVSLK